MKSHDFYLNLADKKGREDLFQMVTNLREFLKIKLTVLELLSSQWNGCHEKLKCKLPYLHVEDKELHRVFIVSNNKIISFSFGLTILASDNHIASFQKQGKMFNTKQISEAQTILNHLDDHTLYHDLELEDDDLETKISNEGKFLFECLTFEEPAYIRYDYDKQTKNEIIHPVNHFDIHFSKDFTFKIGLPRQISEEEYIRILDKKIVCQRLNIQDKYKRLNRGLGKSLGNRMNRIHSSAK